MSNLTDRDLSRLMTLQYVHGGEILDIQRDARESFHELGKAELVQINREELELIGGPVIYTHATITEKGKRVTEAGMIAMREVLK